MPIAYTPAQRHAINCIISVFETGRVPNPSAYATCTILPDGAGISYGMHQSTDRAGSLDNIVKRYIELGGVHAAALQAHLPYFASNKSATEPPKGPWSAETQSVVNLLKTAGADPIMHRAQEEVFDRDYFQPAVNHANSAGVTKALSLAVIYDTCIHSGPGGVTMVRNMFAAKSPANGGDEATWVKAYLNARRNWLATHKMTILHGTVYRMDALMTLVNEGNWDLKMPFKCRGVTVA
jgi:chitosanase